MKAKVTGEYYLLTDGYQEIVKRYNTYTKEMFWDAFLLSGENRQKAVIMRVTEFKIPENKDNLLLDLLFDEDGIGSKVTGIYIVEPPHFAEDTELSRYHPNNGGVIPDEIEI